MVIATGKRHGCSHTSEDKTLPGRALPISDLPPSLMGSFPGSNVWSVSLTEIGRGGCREAVARARLIARLVHETRLVIDALSVRDFAGCFGVGAPEGRASRGLAARSPSPPRLRPPRPACRPNSPAEAPRA